MSKAFGPYPGTVISQHDGDTVLIELDQGFGQYNRGLNCRVYGINAPELKTQQGKEALAFAQTLLHVGDKVTVMSYGWDKFGGRYDGSITLADGRDYAQVMVDSGHAIAAKY